MFPTDTIGEYEPNTRLSKTAALAISALLLFGLSAYTANNFYQMQALTQQIIQSTGIGNQVVNISIGLILLATIGVAAIGLIANANTTGWDASVITLFQTVTPIVAIIAVVLFFLRRTGKI